ncbi:MAG: Fe-S cluster assembly protein SufD [Sulfuricaulis sp.]|nr:Fe-S cluster assembly protein SufD [Sulfuricaulis sp.]
MNPNSTAKETYLDAMGAAEKGLASAPSWLRDLRRGGASRFAEVGFPTPRDEAWKYTDVTPIVQAGFKPAARGVNGMDPAQLEGFWFENMLSHRLVFVNGHYSEKLSTPGAWPKGVTVMGLAEALRDKAHRLEPYLGHYVPEKIHGFAALNTALFTDGAYIHLGRGTRLAKPIHLLYVSAGAADPLLSQPRNLVVAEADSQAVLIENYVAVGEAAYFTNALTEVVVGPHAVIEHYRLQEEGTKAYHIGGLHARLDRDGRFTAHGIDLGGRLVRNDLRSVLDAAGAECHLNGLYVIGGRQHVDNYTHIDHVKPHGTSREFYKGVLDGRSRAVFHGRVVVHPDAQHTDAQQVNNNLLLSRDAEADTKPQLEIYADDVKCAHGATVGQLDPDALFYLRSRAVDEAAARDLLTYAFARDVLSRLRLEPVRSQLERNLAAKLSAAALHQAKEVFH